MAYDLLIKDGLVVDGTGLAAFRADVGVKGDKIVAIGNLKGAQAGKTINAEGLIVSPGFVDTHTHYDAQFFWDPTGSSSCYQGVTTVVTGNCGFTLAPCRPDGKEYLLKLFSTVEGVPLKSLAAADIQGFPSFPKYLDMLDRPLGVNATAFVGHSAVRHFVMGEDSYQRTAKPDEIERMKQLVREAMAAGAIGFASSQGDMHVGGYGEPVPSRLASQEEILELMSAAGEFHCGFNAINQKRAPDGSTFHPINKTFYPKICQVAGRPLVWNSLLWRSECPDEYVDILNFMSKASREQGAAIYTMFHIQRTDLEFTLKTTAIFDLFPSWRQIIHSPHAERLQLLRKPEVRQKMATEMAESMKASLLLRSKSIDLATVHHCKLEKNRHLNGVKLTDLATRRGVSVLDAMLDLALEEDLDTDFMYWGVRNGNDDEVEKILRHPHVVIGVSDGGAHVVQECGAMYTSYSLGYWVREKKALPLEDTIRRLSSVPAAIAGLTDRGVIKEGMAADLNIFDINTIRPQERVMVNDFPGGSPRLVQKAEGITHTVVNGRVLVDHGQLTGELPGTLLRSTRYRGN